MAEPFRERTARPEVHPGDAQNPHDLPTRSPAGLIPDIEIALRHPLRRELLQLLATNPEGRSLVELARELPGTSISTVSYHLHFLGHCGTVSLSTSPWRDGSPTWRYGCDFAAVR